MREKIPYPWGYYLKNWSDNPTFLMQKIIQQNAHAKLKKSGGVEFFQLQNFHLFNLSRIYST